MSTCSLIRSKVEPHHIEEAKAILSRLHYIPRQDVVWANGDFIKAKAIALELASYRPSSTCLACHFRVINILREVVGQPPIGGEASPRLRDHRLSICRGVAPDGSDACRAFHHSTQSCGRLILGAIMPERVTISDGRQIQPCGCFMPLKASIKSERCPANLW